MVTLDAKTIEEDPESILCPAHLRSAKRNILLEAQNFSAQKIRRAETAMNMSSSGGEATKADSESRHTVSRSSTMPVESRASSKSGQSNESKVDDAKPNESNSKSKEKQKEQDNEIKNTICIVVRQILLSSLIWGDFLSPELERVVMRANTV